MDRDRDPGGLVEPEEARARENDSGAVRVHRAGQDARMEADGRRAEPGIGGVQTRESRPDTFRTQGADAETRREGTRWGDALTGLLTALTTFLLLELLVWGMGLPAGSDRLGTSYGIGPPDWVTGFLGLLAFLIGGYIAGISSATQDRRPGRPGLHAGLLVWLLGTLLILVLSAFAPDILGAIWGAPADLMGTDISADNTGGVAETVSNDALGAFFSLLLWGLASGFGGWIGNLTREQV